jgi:hypothetical protein
MIMRKSVPLGAAILVAACGIAATGADSAADAQTARQARPKGQAPARRPWIVGAWHTTRVNCWGNGKTFVNGGVYYAVNGRGRWRLAGNVLTLVMTHETDGESDFPLRQSRRTIVRVSPLPGGRMSWREGNRPATVMVRCPQG